MPAINPHQALLEAQLPHWAGQVTPNQWAALKRTQTAPWQAQAWFANAAPDLRETVHASQARLTQAQAALAGSLKGLKQITEFAEPLLQRRLAEHGFHAPLRNSQLLRVERSWQWAALRYLYRHRRDNLLQAALQNFASDEVFTAESAIALNEDIQVTPILVQGSTPLGMQAPLAHFPLKSEHYQVERLPLEPAAFAILCRDLDLGKAYQAHLEQHLAQPATRALAIRVQKGRLRLAADLAYLRHLLDGSTRDQIEQLLQGGAVRCWQLALFGTPLHEVMLIDAGSAGLALYLPGHDPALRQCSNLNAVHDTLATLLLEPDARQAFTAYIRQDQRTHFFDLLQQNLDAAGNTAFDRPWQRAGQADLRPTRMAITAEPFGHYQDLHLARLKHEASLLAVPTAMADANARTRRLEEWESLGLDALGIAAFFVPGAGTLMLAVTACQLLGEAFEGYQAWHEGDRHLALRHLEAVGLNLALIGGFVAAGKVVPKLFNSPLMESLQQVRGNDGRYRLWNEDLTPYRSAVTLPETLQPNALGQYLYEGRHFIRMDGQLFEQRFDHDLQQWRVIHPNAPDAWQPPLTHNAQGAWRGQHEQPGQWPFAELARRLGQAYTAFTPEQLTQAGRLCGIDADYLRRVHLEGRATPPLLLDALQRIAAQAEVEALADRAPPGLFEHLYNGSVPTTPSTQKLLAAYPRLSPALATRLLAPLGEAESLAWEQQGLLPIQLRQALEQVHSELPLVRALEGVLQPARASSDSERLLFSALDAMPDWPADLRLELRGASPEGPLLEQVGSGQASTLRRVIKLAEGYEVDRGERPAPGLRDPDLCRAIEQALPGSHRDTLGIPTADGSSLRQRVLGWIEMHRQTLAQRLWGHRALLRKPMVSLRGGRPLDPDPPQPRLAGSLAGAYRRLFPNATDWEFENWLGNDEDSPYIDDIRSPTQRLHDLQQRLDTLRHDLHEWARPDPQRPHQRHLAIRPIINAWRRLSTVALEGGGRLHSLDLSGLELDNQDLASLALPDDFTHVQHLSLSYNRSLSQLPAGFQERFPNLNRLLLTDCRFDTVPRLGSPEHLAWLDLEGNRITWSTQAQQALNRCSGLVVLDLSGNPLLQAPDLRGLANLRTLFLNDCALSELPQGLDQMVEPIIVDVADNQLLRLPDGFNLPRPVAEALRLESEWLGAPVVAQIEAYNAAHQVDLMVCASDYQEFFEQAGPAEMALWQRLPLQYRRDLRALLDLEPFLSRPRYARTEFWRRLALIDADPVLRQQWLTHPPYDLFNLPL
ncbi:leucine-rich repeat domain-containing protein [Pseudomonas putida]|uniref:Leucine-rich repeat domain-containing protein n=1 Tax=Pseudomonas putida TaxID=303 RepID=A0AAW4BS58_PSEPU|nr:leucine-rich repeat domain-containing protein [Pseudomonas putida]MBF8703691.1 leucine-rich repeat domain-containing protein [Pseudomonas putida]MBF8735220.1 leucine-rich repeat domain-containing protein [Pseudomonas putida]